VVDIIYGTYKVDNIYGNEYLW